jgi:hypothetical protein
LENVESAGDQIMTVSLLVIMVVLAAAPGDDPAAKATDRAAYEAAKKQAGRDAQANVRLALWCEAHGMTAERMKHLAEAVLHDPANALARGLLGMVAYNGRWQRPEEVSREAKDEPSRRALMQEYLERRAKAPETADGQFKLASWCEQNGLKPQAAAHFQRVVRLDPKREAAWRHLGFKNVGARWVKPELVAAEKARAQEQQKADRHWKPILERYRSGLQSKSSTRRAEAEQSLARITERDAVPMVWAVFGRGEPSTQKVAVQVLGQIDDGAASRALAMLAVFGGSPEVRRQATETLRRRDVREFASTLIAMILEPIEYEVKRLRGPGQGGELLIKGQGSAPNLKRLYSPPAGPSIGPLAGDYVVYDENGLPVLLRPRGLYSSGIVTLGDLQAAARMYPAAPASNFPNLLARSGLGAQGQKLGQMLVSFNEHVNGLPGNVGAGGSNYLLQEAQNAPSLNPGIPLNPTSGFVFQQSVTDVIPVGRMALEAQKTAYVAGQQLDSDVAAIEEYNQGLAQINDRILPVLRDVSGLDLGPKPLEWRKWYVNQVGYRLNLTQTSENPTVVENVLLAYQPQPVPIGQIYSPAIGIRVMSCFGAGTPVRTLTGLEPIETLKIGDAVLTQSTRTGALAYKPIVTVHHNPPSKTFRVRLGGETIVSSEFHRFWKAGQGWVMARDIKEGDLIRTLDGPSTVTSIERGDVVLVYNLDVADDNDFFVGSVGALVHDNTLPDLRETPFDAVGPLTSEPVPATPRSLLGR